MGVNWAGLVLSDLGSDSIASHGVDIMYDTPNAEMLVGDSVVKLVGKLAIVPRLLHTEQSFASDV